MSENETTAPQKLPIKWRLPRLAMRIVSRLCCAGWRYAFNCVQIHAEIDSVSFTATDGRMLFISRHDPWFSGKGPTPAITALLGKRLARSIACGDIAELTDDGAISITYSAETPSAMQITAPLQKQKFPILRDVLKHHAGSEWPTKKLEGAIKVNLDSLIKLLQAASDLQKQDDPEERETRAVYLAISKNQESLVLQSRGFKDLGLLMGMREENEQYERAGKPDEN